MTRLIPYTRIKKFTKNVTQKLTKPDVFIKNRFGRLQQNLSGDIRVDRSPAIRQIIFPIPPSQRSKPLGTSYSQLMT